MTPRSRTASSKRRQERYERPLTRVHTALTRLQSNGRNTMTLKQARPALEFGLRFLWLLEWHLKPENAGQPHARSRAYTIWVQIETRELLCAHPTAKTRARIQEAIDVLTVYITATKKSKDFPALDSSIELFKDLAGQAKELGY